MSHENIKLFKFTLKTWFKWIHHTLSDIYSRYPKVTLNSWQHAITSVENVLYFWD